MKILIAGFYTPGIMAIQELFALGYSRGDIKLLTYNMEENRPLLSFAKRHGIDVITDSIKDKNTYIKVSNFAPDIMLSLYYRDIFPKEYLEIPIFPPVNLHPALLPKYRGTFSSAWAIINNEQVTGFTYHFMTESIDRGDILFQEKLDINSDDTAFSLYHRLISKGLSRFSDILNLLITGNYKPVPQIGEGSYYRRSVPYDGFINTSWKKDFIERYIRALFFPPYPMARVRLNNGEVKEVASIDEYEKLMNLGVI